MGSERERERETVCLRVCVLVCVCKLHMGDTVPEREEDRR